MFQLRLDEVQVFNRESAWQQEQARMRQGRDRDDGWRRIQVCVEESGSDEEEERSRNGRDGKDKRDRFPSSHILERRRSYKSQQKGSAYQEHGASYHLGQRMAGSSAYREHGMTKPPALFSYHNVQKKSCLVEELEESETEEEEEGEREMYEEEKESEAEATEEEEEKEASWW